MTIDNLVREEVLELKNYKIPEISYNIKLDANENNWGLPRDIIDSIKMDIEDFSFHRYPHSDSSTLREKLSGYTGVNARNLMVGTGSDELIQYVVHTFVGRGDRVVIHTPTFSMYDFFTTMSGGVTVEVESDGDFVIDVEKIINAAVEQNAKVVFICNPNNPSGNVLSREKIKRIIEETPAVIVVDEAYYEFYGRTVIDWVYRYENLIVMRTFSKAMALGGLRVGYMAAGDKIMGYMNRVKVPYNVSSFSQFAACRVLEEDRVIKEWLSDFGYIRQDFVERLASIDGVKVFPTQANFVLIEVQDAEKIWRGLVDKGILVRKFSDRRLKNCFRVTIGQPQENRAFSEELWRCIQEG